MDRNDSWPAWRIVKQANQQTDSSSATAGPATPSRRPHRVPDLQLDLLVLDVDHARAELDADREVVHRLEALVRELQQQARLAHACGEAQPVSAPASILLHFLHFASDSPAPPPRTRVADDDVLEQVRVRHIPCAQPAVSAPSIAPQRSAAHPPELLGLSREPSLLSSGLEESFVYR